MNLHAFFICLFEMIFRFVIKYSKHVKTSNRKARTKRVE